MKIPFVDLKTQYEFIKNEIDVAVNNVLDSCAFAGGPFVEKFENEFAAFCNCKQAVGVGSGTEALWLALAALGVGSGDEVITVPNTFIATAEAISCCGAIPVFIDIDERTYNMNPDLIEKKINSRTKAIVPVHLYGQMADMDPIMEIADRHHLVVVEDACQAHGAEYKGWKAGSVGTAGCFSFYPGKNLGAYGEAGAVVTNDPDLAAKIRMLRDHGQYEKYYHSCVGCNARMDGIQGAILSVKLNYLNVWNTLRRKNASIYTDMLSEANGITTPFETAESRHNYHLYVIRSTHRDDLMSFLKQEGIQCAIHYPVPVHLQKAYAGLNLLKGSFPVSEKVSDEIVSLPMFPELTTKMIETVCLSIKKWCDYETIQKRR